MEFANLIPGPADLSRMKLNSISIEDEEIGANTLNFVNHNVYYIYDYIDDHDKLRSQAIELQIKVTVDTKVPYILQLAQAKGYVSSFLLYDYQRHTDPTLNQRKIEFSKDPQDWEEQKEQYKKEIAQATTYPIMDGETPYTYQKKGGKQSLIRMVYSLTGDNLIPDFKTITLAETSEIQKDIQMNEFTGVNLVIFRRIDRFIPHMLYLAGAPEFIKMAQPRDYLWGQLKIYEQIGSVGIFIAPFTILLPNQYRYNSKQDLAQLLMNVICKFDSVYKEALNTLKHTFHLYVEPLMDHDPEFDLNTATPQQMKNISDQFDYNRKDFFNVEYEWCVQNSVLKQTYQDIFDNGTTTQHILILDKWLRSQFINILLMDCKHTHGTLEFRYDVNEFKTYAFMLYSAVIVRIWYTSKKGTFPLYFLYAKNDMDQDDPRYDYE
jgi:hypothetical protein